MDEEIKYVRHFCISGAFIQEVKHALQINGFKNGLITNIYRATCNMITNNKPFEQLTKEEFEFIVNFVKDTIKTNEFSITFLQELKNDE